MQPRSFLNWGGALLAVQVVACGAVKDLTNGEDKPRTDSRLMLFHTVETWGNMEARLNGILLGTFAPNRVSNDLSFAPGSYTLSVRTQGAAADVLQLSDLTFSVQSYFLAFFDGDDGVESLLLDERPPELQDNEAAVEILGLFGTDEALDIYVDGTLFAEEVEHAHVSDVLVLQSGKRQVAVRRHGDAPTALTLANAEVQFAPMSASILIIRSQNQNLVLSKATRSR